MLSICADPLNSNGWWFGDSKAVRYCDGQTVSLVAGGKIPDFSDGVGPSAHFSYVCGLICTTSDQKWLYLADSFNNRIRRIEIKSRVVSTIAGSGQSKSEDGTGLAASILCPASLVFDRSPSIKPESAVWIVATGPLRRLDITTGVVTSTTVGTGIKVDSYTSLCCTTTGTLILLSENALYSFDPPTHTLRVLAGWKHSGYADGPGLSARFSLPRGLAMVDRERCAYIADTNNHRIRRVTLPPSLFH